MIEALDSSSIGQVYNGVSQLQLTTLVNPGELLDLWNKCHVLRKGNRIEFTLFCSRRISMQRDDDTQSNHQFNHNQKYKC